MVMTRLPTPSGANTPRGSSLPLSPTTDLIADLLQQAPHASDLVFSPMRPPQVLVNYELVTIELPGLPAMIPADTERIAGDILLQSQSGSDRLQAEGACEVAYYVPGLGRFRASIFAQRGSFSISLRVLPHPIRSLAELGLPEQLGEIARLRDGLVFVSGLGGTGRSTTIASLVDAINEARPIQIVTLDNPLEYLHRHKTATLLQRELYRDVPNFASGIRAALRQSAKVIAVGEMNDRETLELALEAAESGQLVIVGMRSANVTRTLERLTGFFALPEQPAFCSRLARSLRYIVAQRLLPQKGEASRLALCEIFIADTNTRGLVERSNYAARVMSDAMRRGAGEGMQCFEDTLDRMIRRGLVDLDAAEHHATDILENPVEPVAPARRSSGN